MRAFLQELDRRQRHHSHTARRWVFVPYDQLTHQMGPLSRTSPGDLGIIVVECPTKAGRRPYHRQKLALELANLRHFALEQAARGVSVKHVVSPGSYADALRPLVPELGCIEVMEPAERELREDLRPLVATGGVQTLPHEGWITAPDALSASQSGPPWRMDAFYRYARRTTGILMDHDRPIGGKYSFDVENRRPYRGHPAPPEPPRFVPDVVTREVAELVNTRFASHPGRVDLGSLPATAADAEAMWRWAWESCLPHFGPFEDAMWRNAPGLFHTRISSLVNLHRLLPARVLGDALSASIPLASQEGFIRQILGWREFVRHVHRHTNGFRAIATTPSPVADRPGDGGFSIWSSGPWPTPPGTPGGACPSFLGAQRPLPLAYWGAPSGLACLDHVVTDVWRDGWSHHITRLMVLANLATLLDTSPRLLTDWFWVAYTDAYDWVVEPNVLGMGTFAVGELFTTKPYVCGAAYINRMSNYCEACRFDPHSSCPITPLYWAFLARHEEQLASNPRLALPMRSLAKRPPAQSRRDAAVFEDVSARLGDAAPLDPDRTDSI